MAVFLSQGTVRDKLKPKKISLKTLGLHFSDMWDIFQEVAVWTSWKLQNQVTKEKPVRMLCVLLPSSVWLFFPCLQWSHPGAEADRCGRRQKGKAKTQHSLSWRSCICSGEGGGGAKVGSPPFFFFLNSGVRKYFKRKSLIYWAVTLIWKPLWAFCIGMVGFSTVPAHGSWQEKLPQPSNPLRASRGIG